MSTGTLTRNPHFAPVEASRILFWATLFVRRLRRRVKMQSDRHALRGMPEYLLRDIGISRSQIDHATLFGRFYDGPR